MRLTSFIEEISRICFYIQPALTAWLAVWLLNCSTNLMTDWICCHRSHRWSGCSFSASDARSFRRKTRLPIPFSSSQAVRLIQNLRGVLAPDDLRRKMKMKMLRCPKLAARRNCPGVSAQAARLRKIATKRLIRRQTMNRAVSAPGDSEFRCRSNRRFDHRCCRFAGDVSKSGDHRRAN